MEAVRMKTLYRVVIYSGKPLTQKDVVGKITESKFEALFYTESEAEIAKKVMEGNIRDLCIAMGYNTDYIRSYIQIVEAY
jgi:hypothetical protein